MRIIVIIGHPFKRVVSKLSQKVIYRLKILQSVTVLTCLLPSEVSPLL